MKKTNTIAIVGFGVSIISWFINYGVAEIFAGAGLILSIIGLVQIREQEQKGKVFAILGIIIAALSFVMLMVFAFNPSLLQ